MQFVALTEEEVARIRDTASILGPVSTAGSRFVGVSKDIVIGPPTDAVRGLESAMRVSEGPASTEYLEHVCSKVIGIKQEVNALAKSTGLTELNTIIEYITASAGLRHEKYDKSRSDSSLKYFLEHCNAKSAGLSDAEVVALRLYTTSVYVHMNGPLRSAHQDRPCPLAACTRWASDGIKKLRQLYVNARKNQVLWRGLCNRKVNDDFMVHGGTERGFMSATKRLDLAVRYSLTHHQLDQHALLFRIVVPNFFSAGAELNWLSAFPEEDEVLFPPLTFLQPTGRIDTLEVEHGERRISFAVIEVEPHIV